MARSAAHGQLACLMLQDSAANQCDVKRTRRLLRSSAAIPSSRTLALIALIGFVTGCAEIVPRFELRDDYMFKRFIQPDRVVSEVERDELGNPVLPETESEE